jgi:hypothetical protein
MLYEMNVRRELMAIGLRDDREAMSYSFVKRYASKALHCTRWST